MKAGFDYIGVGIGAVIVNNDGKIFLNLRGEKAKNESGMWEFPGGAMDFGETFETTLVREIKEEFEFTIEPVEQLVAFNHRIPKEKQHWVAISFLCKIKEGTPIILEPEKSAQIGWFIVSEMAHMTLTPPTQHEYELLLKRYPKGMPNYY